MAKAKLLQFCSATQEIPTPSTPKLKKLVRIRLDADLVSSLELMAQDTDRHLPAVVALALKWAMAQYGKGAEVVRS